MRSSKRSKRTRFKTRGGTGTFRGADEGAGGVDAVAVAVAVVRARGVGGAAVVVIAGVDEEAVGAIEKGTELCLVIECNKNM